MNLIILFFVFCLSSISGAEDKNMNIYTEIDLCKKTERRVNFEEDCNQFMDEYKSVLTLQEKKIFYFSNFHV